MAYLRQTGKSVWNYEQTGLELMTTNAIAEAIEKMRPFTMLPNAFCPLPVHYNW